MLGLMASDLAGRLDCGMYCRGCLYPLEGLEDERCPECGRGFVRLNPVTYLSETELLRRRVRWRWMARGMVLLGATPLVANVRGFGALLLARWSLGRWPARFGADEPGDVPWAGVLAFPALLLAIVSVPALIFWLGLGAVFVGERAWKMFLRGGLGGLVLWLIGFGLMRYDPAQVWVWLWD